MYVSVEHTSKMIADFLAALDSSFAAVKVCLLRDDFGFALKGPVAHNTFKVELMSDVVLILAAHPDDEILGCGGTIARLVNGANRFTLLLWPMVWLREET